MTVPSEGTGRTESGFLSRDFNALLKGSAQLYKMGTLGRGRKGSDLWRVGWVMGWRGGWREGRHGKEMAKDGAYSV